MTETTPTPDGQDAARARKQLREGCSTNLGCLLLPVLTAVACALTDQVNRVVSRILLDPQSADVAFVELEGLAGQVGLVGGLTVLMTLLFIGAAWEKSRVLGVLLAVPLLALGAWAGYDLVYDDFIALAARDGEIRLFYRWPRPSIVIPGSSVLSTENEKVPGTDMVAWNYRLWVNTTAGNHRSEKTGSDSTVDYSALLVQRERYAGAMQPTGDPAAHVAAMARLGLIQIRLEKRDAARALCQDALATAGSNADELGIASAEYCLGRIDELEQRYGDAERRYRRALEIRMARLDDEHPDLYDAAGSLAALLDTLQRPDEAREVRGMLPPRTILTEMRRTMSKEEAEKRVRELIEQRRK